MMKYITLGGRRIRAPFFAATVSDNEHLWPWKRGVRPDALLVSYDVLQRRPKGTTSAIDRTLDFNGFVLVDSGGYGVSIETNPAAVYEVQHTIGANLAVCLDVVARPTDPPQIQWRAVNTTVRNARSVRRRKRGRMALEAVVQGATPRQLVACSGRLGALNFDVYGVPVSFHSKYRQYAAATERLLRAAAALPSKATIHALGCGSRTLMAIFSYVGVTIFDSHSYYQRAMYGENIEGVTMCALGAPRAKASCGACLDRRRPGRSLEGRVDYNLNEMMKEVARLRCAREESMTEAYLQRRLGKKLFAEISAVIDRVAPHWRRRREPR